MIWMVVKGVSSTEREVTYVTCIVFGDVSMLDFNQCGRFIMYLMMCYWYIAY